MNLHRNDVKSIRLLVDPFIDDLCEDISTYIEIKDQLLKDWNKYFTSQVPELKLLIDDLYNWIEEYIIFHRTNPYLKKHDGIVYLWMKEIRDEYNFCADQHLRLEIWKKLELVTEQADDMPL